MVNAAKAQPATAGTTAARVYLAFQQGAAEDGLELPDWSGLGREGSRPWFAVAAAIGYIAAVPGDTKEPYDYDLEMKVEPIQISDAFTEGDGSKISDANDEVMIEVIPETLRIRPMVAGDLYHREYDKGSAAFDMAIRAHIHGIELDMLEERLDPADADAANILLRDVTGADAWYVMRKIYLDAGGLVVDAGIHGWRAAAHELLADENDRYYLLRCRTPGLGTLKIGPYRVGHMRTYDDVSVRKTEWEGRLAALAKATGRELGELEGIRIEDADRAWSCLQILKKKVDRRTRSIVAARRSSTSTAGDGQTSSPSPSTS